MSGNMKSSATRPTTRPAQQRRRPRATFFSLPGELRNKIYRLALVKGRTIVLDADQLELLERGDPALLRSNNRVKAEAHRIYFEENMFRFTNESLTSSGITTFRLAIGNAYKNLKQISVRRSYQIGDMKPIVIAYHASIQYITERGKKRPKIVIDRPRDEKMPFPGIRSKMRGRCQEPCRCEVDTMARAWQLSDESSGLMLLEFLNEYTERINTAATHAEIQVCRKCNSVRRT
ncbi:hypothetical protein DOTSEDRAFT_49466 [Dothistroma septosporum NZE10]|uniref:Uncharacterized protein n=1 Tax=Dothistroma septosporum (strain NZE10 / CBS 128990) TaxID=675120 RepID=N1Q0F9_DOTSN|nr:hypothetical protein DOTSEDRAFT_49466 [Dothistroma septosporum NZE10]